MAIFARGANEPPCLNFLVSPCAEINLPIHAVLDGAYSSGPRFTFRPELVSHVDYTRTPPFTFTYHIRSEARWSDGVPVTARDFVFTHEAIRKYSPPDWDNGHRTRVRSVRALDAKTLVVVLRSRFAFWRQLFNVVLPQHALRGEDLARVWLDRIDNPKTGKPIGSWPLPRGALGARQAAHAGEEPSLLEATCVPGAHRHSLCRRRWRNQRRRTDRRSIPKGRRSTSLINRLASPISSLDFGRCPASAFASRSRPNGSTSTFGVARADTRRSRAKSYAARSRMPSIASHSCGRCSARLPRGRNLWTARYFSAPAARTGPTGAATVTVPVRCAAYSSRRAAEGVSDGIYACAGRKLSLRFISRGAPPRRVQTLELIHAQLRQVGIEVVPSYVSPSAHNQILASGDFDVTLFAWTSGAESGDDELYGCGGAQNYTGYCQRLVTRGPEPGQSDTRLGSAGARPEQS